MPIDLRTFRRVRICANKVVADVRWSTLPPNIRQENTRQITSARDFNQFEGLAVAIPWGFEPPFRTNLRFKHFQKFIRENFR